ncbi:hypothetical protein DFH09DRAFT_1339914 [Mycena vulgaris]|nr:hypothetical protein DFH09DRAFT_1339914 [Mycena vulgaris]
MPSLNFLLLLISATAFASALPQGTSTAPTTLPTLSGACAPLWAQCTSENQNWIGPACCEGTTCVISNPFWSQCLAPS